MVEINVYDDFAFRAKKQISEINQLIDSYKKKIENKLKNKNIDIKIECGISKGIHIDANVFCNKKKYSIRCKDISKFIYYLNRCISDDIHIVEENRPHKDIIHVYCA